MSPFVLYPTDAIIGAKADHDIWPVTEEFTFTAADSGSIRGNNAVYPTARATAANAFTSMTSIGQKPGFLIRRAFMRFDTSSLSGKSPVSATLTMTVSADESTTNFVMEIGSYLATVWPIALTEVDYDGALAAVVSERVLFFDTATFPGVDTPMTSPTLSGAWINTTGYTGIVLVSQEDRLSSNPGANDEAVDFYLETDATAAFRPVLTVLA
jgi:hypothetical protein